jgi:hypothetical protein
MRRISAIDIHLRRLPFIVGGTGSISAHSRAAFSRTGQDEASRSSRQDRLKRGAGVLHRMLQRLTRRRRGASASGS